LATGLHGATRTTPRVRSELQAAQESTRTLAARYGLNAKTVAKWRMRLDCQPADGANAAFPYKLHTILTDNGTPFTDEPNKRSGPTTQHRLHVFDRTCRNNGIVHKLTKPLSPMDQWSGRTNEPYRQGRHRAGLPLRHPLPLGSQGLLHDGELQGDWDVMGDQQQRDG
jgi:hypothetical protein